MGYAQTPTHTGGDPWVDTDTLPHLLDIDGLAVHLGTSRRHIRRLIAERRIPYEKVGRLIRFDPQDITAWLDHRRHPME